MTSLYVWDNEATSDEVVVCLHTIPLDGSYFRNSTKTANPDIRVIVVDLPSHGQSDRLSEDKLNFFDMAELLQQQLAELQLSKFHLLGHGVGGFVALHYAMKYQHSLKSLILLNSAGNNRYRNSLAWNIRDRYSKSTIQALNQYAGKTDDKSIRVRFTQSLATYFSPTDHDSATELMDNCDRIATEEYVHMSLHAIEKYDIRDQIRKIRVPTLVLGGLRDVWPLAHVELLNIDIGGSQYVVLDSGHFPMVENPAMFWSYVTRFILNPDEELTEIN